MNRVLFVAHSGQLSGAEKVMADVMQQALRNGLQVVVACPHGPLSEQLPAGCHHVAIDSLGLNGERGVTRVLEAVRLLRRWWSVSRALSPYTRTRGTRTIVNSLLALPAVRMARPVGGAAWLVHDTVVTTKQRVVSRIGRPVVRTAVAMSEAAAAPQRSARMPVARARYGVPLPERPFSRSLRQPATVGMLALLTPWKGHLVLLEAVSSLPGVRVEVAGGHFPGDEAYVAALRARAAQPDLSGRVSFVGHVDPSDALSRWDIAVSASTSPEAGPLSVLEAMSHGVPVIGTDHGGTRELLVDGAGVLVPPGDVSALAAAIDELLANDVGRQRIITKARERVVHDHDIAETLPALMTVLLA